MFGWLKRLRRIEPEARWIVTVDDDRISGRDATGVTKSVAKSELASVAIATNDSGPWGADVWWLLFDSGGQLACAFPQQATGEQAAIDYLFALPGFDHGEVSKAMGSTDNAVFIVWRRADIGG